MKSTEVVAEVESPQREEEADLTDGLSREALEASSPAELGGASHVRAKDDEKKKNKKKRKKKEFYMCRFCNKTFTQGQALGGHMNGHPEARNQEKMVHYEKLLQKMNLRPFRTVNASEYVQETSSYPISNFNQPGDGCNMVTPMLSMQPPTFFQQPLQQMVPSQDWPVDPQQFSLPQASTDGMNLRRPTNDFTQMSNLSTTYTTSDASVNGNYGPQSMDPSMSGLPPQYGDPTPSSISSNILYGDSIPCDCCNPWGSATYQDPQMNMHSLHTQQGNQPTLIENQPMPLDVQMDNSSGVQLAQSLIYSSPDLGSQEMAVPQGTRLQPDPSRDCCNPWGSVTYQDPQMNMHSLHAQQGNQPTLVLNQPMPLDVQMDISSSVQQAQSLIYSYPDLGNQEMAVPQGTRMQPDPSGDCCNPWGSGTYQDPQMNMYNLHTQQGNPPTLIENQPMPLDVQMDNSSSVQLAQSLIDSFPDLGSQEMAVPQGTRIGPDPSDASDGESNDFSMLDLWSGNPTDYIF